MSEFTESIEQNLAGCKAFSVGSCPGCAECGLDDEPTDHAQCLADEPHFSWSACDSCCSTFGGDRHPAHFIHEGKYANVIVHCNVCTDCLFFHANGDEPDDWQKHP